MPAQQVEQPRAPELRLAREAADHPSRIRRHPDACRYPFPRGQLESRDRHYSRSILLFGLKVMCERRGAALARYAWKLGEAIGNKDAAI